MRVVNWRAVATLAILFAVPAPTPAADRPATTAAAETFEPVKHANIAYRTDKDADPERHKLDLYVPKGRKDFPVLMFVHGGTWRSGSKNLYTAFGNAFAKLGIGVVIPNYRLSPKVKHPAHVEDVAKAFAWTHANIGSYGGKPDHLYVCGHSAGGHLVSLLATDPAYLKAENRSPADIRGVVAVSGVYRIYHNFPAFEQAFGTDEELCRKASPVCHAGGKHPPFLIAYADDDFRELDRMAEEMHAALKKAGTRSTVLKVNDRTHYTIVIKLIDPTDELHKAIRAFVK